MSESLQSAHERAFSVAAATPVQTIAEARSLIDQMVAEGASFHEARTALQHLFVKSQGMRKE